MRSLDKILSKITQQPEWQEYQQYEQLLKYWRQVISHKVSQNTRPLYFSQGVFGLATASAAWAQELTLQRYSLLKKLNKLLKFEVKDLRFTPARWNDILIQDKQADLPKTSINQENSSSFLEKQIVTETNFSIPETVDESLNNWIERIKINSTYLPLCPQCNSPTPQKELDRWHFCCHCMSHRKYLEYR